jgi:hypothetical protein
VRVGTDGLAAAVTRTATDAGAGARAVALLRGLAEREEEAA